MNFSVGLNYRKEKTEETKSKQPKKALVKKIS